MHFRFAQLDVVDSRINVVCIRPDQGLFVEAETSTTDITLTPENKPSSSDLRSGHLSINERQDMSEELLGIISEPKGDTLSTSGMAPHDERCRDLHLWMDSC